MIVLSDLADTLQTLLTDEANQAARETRFILRCRQFTGATFVQTLVLGWLHDPHAPVDALVDVAADLGVQITAQGLDKRFTPAASHLMARMLTQALYRIVTTEPTATALLSRFAGVYVYDSTTRSLPRSLVEQFPGSGQGSDGQRPAALKCQVELELRAGALDFLVEPGRQADVRNELVRRPLPPGSLRLADRGYLDLTRLAEDTAAGVHWISRLQAGMLVDGDGRSGTLAMWLKGCQADAVDQEVTVGSEGLKCRLLARRLPPAIVEKRRQRLQKQARKQGRKVSAARWAMCEWDVCITNLPKGMLSLAESRVLLRSRWQIELLFKLWKSHGGLAFSHGERPARVLCEVYAKLVGLVIQHWLLLASTGALLGWSWTKVARRVRRQAVALGQALAVAGAVVVVLERLRERVQRTCKLSKRQRHPTTYQLLQDPEHTDYLEKWDFLWEHVA